MNVKCKFQFGNISKSGYRHYPVLYFAHGTDGFLLTIFGLSITIKL